MAKKRKIRVDFKKNRQKRTRTNDLTRDYSRDERSVSDRLMATERVRAKGDLSRRRTVIQEIDGNSHPDRDVIDDPSALLAVDLSQCLQGRVIRVHGLETIVETPDGARHVCGVRRILKTMTINGRNAVTAGDLVWFRPDGDQQGLIEKVAPRGGVLTRSSKGREHVIAANIDRLLIVVSMIEPMIKPALIDRFLIAAERGAIRPVVVLTKADRVDLSDYQWIVGLYAQLGYEVVATSTHDGRGVARIRELASVGTTVLSGQSGVGKSSLLNAIEPGLNRRVGSVSNISSKGKHTTTFAELVPIRGDAYVVDTPGIRQFELWDVEPAEVEGHFVEFRPFIPHCRFPDCSHTHEHDCAVKGGVAQGFISAPRYKSYTRIYHQQPIDIE